MASITKWNPTQWHYITPHPGERPWAAAIKMSNTLGAILSQSPSLRIISHLLGGRTYSRNNTWRGVLNTPCRTPLRKKMFLFKFGEGHYNKTQLSNRMHILISKNWTTDFVIVHTYICACTVSPHLQTGDLGQDVRFAQLKKVVSVQCPSPRVPITPLSL